MGVETQKLIAACREPTKQLKAAVTGMKAQLVPLAASLQRLEHLPATTDSATMEAALRTLRAQEIRTADAMAALDRRIAEADGVAKQLKAKIDNKSFWSKLKAQADLPAAKVAYDAFADEIATAKEYRTGAQKTFALVVKATVKQTQRVALQTTAFAVIAKLNTYRTATLPALRARGQGFHDAIFEKQPRVEQYVDEATGRDWADGPKAIRIKAIDKLEQDLGKLMRDVTSVSADRNTAWGLIDESKVKNHPAVRTARAQAEVVEDALDDLLDRARDAGDKFAMDLQQAKQAMAGAATVDSVLNALDQCTMMLTDNPTMEQFVSATDEIREHGRFVVGALRNPAAVAEADWDKVNEIERGVRHDEKQVAATYGQVQKTERIATQNYSKFRDNPQATAKWKEYTVALAQRKREYEAFRAVAGPLKASLVKLQAARP